MTDVTVVFNSTEPTGQPDGTLWVNPVSKASGLRVPDISGSKWLDMSRPADFLPSKAMRIAQQLLNRMGFAMGNNSFVSGDSTSGGVLTDVSSLPSGFDLEYPASVSAGPFEYYGSVTPVLDSWGLRFSSSTATGSPSTMLSAAQCEFGLWGDAFVIQLEKPYGSYRILVEEGGVRRPLPLADLPFLTTGSGAQLYKVQFPTVARRVITIEVSGAASNIRNSGRLGSLWVKSATSRAFKVQRSSLKGVWVGDSSFSGVAGRCGTANPFVMAEHMGLRDRKVSGVPGTGFIKAISDTVNYPARRADWIDYAPDFAMFRMTSADGEYDNTDVIRAIMLEVTTLRAARPDCIIFIQDLIIYEGDTSNAPVRNQLIRNAVTALRDPFVKVVSQGTAPLDYWLEQGTGNSASPQGDGPRDVMVNGTEHWSEIGDLMMGIRMAQEIKRALEEIYFGTDKANTPFVAATKVSTLLLMNGSGLTDETGRHTVTNAEGTVTQDGMVRLDGSSSLIVTDNLDDFKIEGHYTIEMQIEADRIDATGNWVWLSTLNDAFDNTGWEVYSLSDANGAKIAFYGDKGANQIASPVVLTGSPVDIAIVNDDTQLRIYVNGTLYIAAGATTQSAAAALRIGREATSSAKNPTGGLRLQITNAALYSGGSYSVPAWPRTALI
jgi:hypothetical protein